MPRTISQLAKELNINVETIRFYERKGIIQQPKKPASGYRHYSDDILQRIRFIKRAQELGFTLNEIEILLSLNKQSCETAQHLAEAKLKKVQEKIANLTHLEHALNTLLKQCKDKTDSINCPIIQSLQGEL